MPYDNLYSREYEKTFVTLTSIRNYVKVYGAIPHTECTDTLTDKSFGHTISLHVAEQQSQHMQLIWYHYNIVCKDRALCVSHMIYGVQKRVCDTLSTYVLAIVRAAITHKSLYVQDALNFYNRVDVLCGNRSYIVRAAISEREYSKKRYRNEFLRTNLNKVHILLANYNYTDTNYTRHVLTAINTDSMSHVYITMVHNCNEVCVTSSISDYAIVTHTKIQQDSLSCINALMHRKFRVNVHVAQPLMLLQNRTVYTTVHNLNDIVAMYNTKSYVCKQHKLYNAQHEGNAFSILYDWKYNMTLKVQHHHYKITYRDNNKYITNISLRQHKVHVNDSSYFSVEAIMRFSFNPNDENYMLSVIQLLAQKDILYTSLYDKDNDLSSLMKQRTNITEKRVPVFINGTMVHNNNMYVYINNTYVNVVHDCDNVCFQLMLSNVDEFMPVLKTQRYGLLCSDMLRTSANLSAQYVVATQNTTLSHVTQAQQTQEIHISDVNVAMYSMCSLPLVVGCIYIWRSSSRLAINIRAYIAYVKDIFLRCKQYANSAHKTHLRSCRIPQIRAKLVMYTSPCDKDAKLTDNN